MSLILRIPEEVSFYLLLALCYSLWWQAPRVNYLSDHFVLYVSFTFFYCMCIEGGSVEQVLGHLCAVLLKKNVLFYSSSHVFMFFMEVGLLPCGCLAADVQEAHFNTLSRKASRCNRLRLQQSC